VQEQVDKYLAKLIRHGLVTGEADAALFGLDDEIVTNRKPIPAEAAALFDLLNINSLLIARPEPALWAVITRLMEESPQLICPRDCESLTFIHDIPVVPFFDPGLVARALSRRKGCIVKDAGIVTTGTVSLEQAFISLSSICFATCVKFFTDTLNALTGCDGAAPPDSGRVEACLDLLDRLAPLPAAQPLFRGIPASEDEIIRAMDDAGKAVVSARLVDSFFGNISFRRGDVIYISQTGSSLDELPGCIDRVPLDGSSTCEVTSSSELAAHARIYELTEDNAIIHGHPRFSVVMSMFGGPLEFGRVRFVGDVPVVAGEVGAGSRGLLHTLPPAMQEHHCAIVSGHGTFASCTGAFDAALERISSIELMCCRACRNVLEGGNIG
jgi:ribulose-5-phosphate 4-epimerase/fuculose-1-phosphate aldolase